MRKAFLLPHQVVYRRWFFKFSLWAQNVHRRVFTVQDTYAWEEEIAVLLSEAELIYDATWSTSATHYFIHLPSGLRLRGPLVFWSMYGLERCLFFCFVVPAFFLSRQHKKIFTYTRVGLVIG
jgi:hypothetical protein